MPRTDDCDCRSAQQLLQQEQSELYKKWRAEVKEQADELQRLADHAVPADHVERMRADWAREAEAAHREKMDVLIQVRACMCVRSAFLFCLIENVIISLGASTTHRRPRDLDRPRPLPSVCLVLCV